jgi:hypothetical protein
VFERFSSALYETLRERLESAPVMAAFHPGLPGSGDAPHRLVGLLRRAPDPFVQLIPEGLHEGGTVFAGTIEGEAAVVAQPDHAELNFRRLKGESIDRLIATSADIRADRDRSYASHLAALD